jgi:RNA polymerase sigma factor (sigma-70 family)
VYKNILFEHLSAQQRQVVELKVFDELSYKEIAQRLVESESNIRQLFSRAIRKLKSIAKKEEEYL